jgi:hypothetical protein
MPSPRRWSLKKQSSNFWASCVCTDLFFVNSLFFSLEFVLYDFFFSDGDIDLIENCAKEVGTGSIHTLGTYCAPANARCAPLLFAVGRFSGPRDGQFVGVMENLKNSELVGACQRGLAPSSSRVFLFRTDETLVNTTTPARTKKSRRDGTTRGWIRISSDMSRFPADAKKGHSCRVAIGRNGRGGRYVCGTSARGSAVTGEIGARQLCFAFVRSSRRRA